MQKLDRHQSKDYGPLVLWFDDLENIFSLLNECSNINIESKDTKYDSIEEFLEQNRGTSLSEVKIWIHDPYFQIELNKYWARLYASSSNLQSAGLFFKIDLILSDCEKKPKFLHKGSWYLLFMIVTFSLSYFPIFLPFANFVPALMFMVVLWSLIILTTTFKTSIVHIFHKKDRPNFFIRNRDSIIIAIFSAVLGGVLTYFVPKIMDNALSKNMKTEVPDNTPQLK